MQNVSDSWKAVQKQQLVNESFVEISFDIADPDALADATSADNGAIYIADTEQIVSEVDKHIVPYGTLEENLWLLNGSRRFIPDSDYGDNGYIGNLLSGADGTFPTIPVITVNFSEQHDPIIPGITITWGEAYGEYAETFRVVAYNGLTVVAEKKVENNTDVKSVVEFDIEGYDRICIEVLKWCLPYHRPRITDIFVGVNKVYSKKDITGYEHEMNVSPIGETTPMNKMSFAIDNSDNKYDPNNVTGLSKYLMQRQQMQVKYGFKMNDDTIEFIPAGMFYLSEWDSPQNGITANFTARDLLEFMSKTYTKGLFNPSGTSLYDLAIDVLTEANLPLNSDGTVKWVVSDTLRSIYTTAPLPLRPLSECLQYIAQASCCVIYCDRNDVLHIEPISEVESDYALTPFNMFSRPEISLQKPLMAVSTKVYNYHTDETGKELFNGKVTINGTKDLVVTYSESAINTLATVSGGTLVSATYYTNTCNLTITASGEVTISVVGDVLRSSDSAFVVDAEEEGETQTVENPLITSTTMASAVSDWVKAWLLNRKMVQMDGWRADPRLDAMDIISSENKFTTEKVRMTSVKFTYAGAFKGTGEGRVVDGNLD